MDAGNARSLVLLIETHDWDSVRVDALIIVNVNLVEQGLRAFLLPSSRLYSSCATLLNLILAMKEYSTELHMPLNNIEKKRVQMKEIIQGTCGSTSSISLCVENVHNMTSYHIIEFLSRFGLRFDCRDVEMCSCERFRNLAVQSAEEDQLPVRRPGSLLEGMLYQISLELRPLETNVRFA